MVRLDRPSYRDNGKDDEETLSIFSLDRIEDIELQQTKFSVAPDFDAASYFDECFGIVIGDGSKPIRIVLRAFGHEPFYMRDLPLHQSQREIHSTGEYTDFELTMRPTSDFKGYVMSKGEWLQVLSPEWLVEDIQKWHQAAIDRYKKAEKQDNQ